MAFEKTELPCPVCAKEWRDWTITLIQKKDDESQWFGVCSLNKMREPKVCEFFSNWDKENNKIMIEGSNFFGHKVTKEEAEILERWEETELIEGLKWKSWKKFSARMKFDGIKISPVFENNK